MPRASGRRADNRMSIPAFYLEASAWSSQVCLKGPECHHLQVLRITPGSEVELLDGEGRLGLFGVESIRKNEVVLNKKSEQSSERPASLPIMALALSKAVRRGFFLEKAAELGAYQIWLFQGELSQGKLVPGLEAKIRQTLIAGCKQCKNPWLPEVRLFPEGLGQLLEEISDIEHRILPWELESTSALIGQEDLGLPGKTIYAIGPEGGFAPHELELFDQAGFRRISLGARILRCETAATLCLGLHWWASHRPETKDCL